VIGLLLAVSAPVGAAPSDASAGTTESMAAASPVAFAERITSEVRRPAGRDSWQNALELIVLAATCAIGVAFYSAATARHTDTRVPVRIRRR
jgi:hypothetical protein